jgi:hypothetical protein
VTSGAHALRAASRIVRPRKARRWEQAQDGGNAIIEFIFVAVLVLMPLVYLVVAIATVQQGRLAVSGAAREVGRAMATAPEGTDPLVRADAALRIALSSRGLGPDDVDITFVAAASACDSPPVTPVLASGAEFAVCVRRRQELPAVPTIVAGRGITVVGRFVVHLDEFRPAPAA